MAHTLDRILSAARASLITGRHVPHCYSAWVQGKGYVNDGNDKLFDRADYLRQLDRDVASEIENMGYAPAYAGRVTGKQPKRGILMANWNRFPRGLDTTLERAGYAVEWSDEWSTCNDCNKAVRTEPDSHDYRPAYVIHDGGFICRACARRAGIHSKR